jgi:predicted HAD superfamily Cof-like phosphohydrolase
MKTKLRTQVEDFRIASGVPAFREEIGGRSIPSIDRLRLTASLCIEEPIETLEGFGADPAIIARMKALAAEAVASITRERCNIVEVADGLGDSDYVNEWARCEFGIDGEPVAAEIQRANLAKFGPGSSFSASGKVQKPPGWSPPDIAEVLRTQRWNVR